MNFWIIAIALLVLSAALMVWPLFTGSAKERITGALTVLIVSLGSLFIYQGVGTPEAIDIPTATVQQPAQSQDRHASQQMQMDDMVAQLQQRMADNPDDPEGWLILGRTLKTMNRYDEAVTALTNANRLSPGVPPIMVELAEATLFASGEPQISPEAWEMLESAIAIDPQQQKGLWLLGMANAQKGNEAKAIEIWQSLLDQLDPDSGAAGMVVEQIDMAKTRLEQGGPMVAAAELVEAAPVEAVPAEAVPMETAAAEFGIPVNVSVAADLAGTVPGNAILFVFIHPAGGAGMPLAVKRLPASSLPMSLNFSDADLLRPEMSLQNFEQLDVSARISVTGTVMVSTGDYQAERVTVNTKAITEIALNLNQRVP
jgi:cytochrome c-type biogenesis protein CcmH